MENELKVPPKDVKDCIILMSMYNDIDLSQRGDDEICKGTSCKVAGYARISQMTLVIPRTWFRREMVRCAHPQTKLFLAQRCRT